MNPFVKINKPFFSIIIPVFNVSEFLGTCLESIREQCFNDFEVILIDDGSTDSSGKICDTFVARDRRFTVVHKQNAGVSSARNDGLNSATGDYIFIMDSDDWIEPETLRSVHNRLSEFPYELVVFGLIKHRRHRGSISRSAYIPPALDIRDGDGKEHIYRIFERGCGHSHWTSVFSRAFLAEHDIKFEQIKRNEDMNFMLDAYMKATNILVIDKAFYNYRIFSASHKFNEVAIENHAAIFDKFHILMTRFCGTASAYTQLRVFLSWFMHSVPTNFVRTHQLSGGEKIDFLKRIYRDPLIARYTATLSYTNSVTLNLLFFLFKLKSAALLYGITKFRFFVSDIVPVNLRR